MKVITLEDLKADRITYIELIVERNEQLAQLQQQVNSVQVSIFNLEGALAHVNQNIKSIEDDNIARMREEELKKEKADATPG